MPANEPSSGESRLICSRNTISLSAAALLLNALVTDAFPQAPEAAQPIAIGSRLELMVDDLLIERMDGVRLQLQVPQRMPLAKSPLANASYATVIKDGDLYRAYYRDYYAGYQGGKEEGNPGEVTCYAESPDGVEWRKPNLGLCEVNGSRANNVILYESPFSHNFSAFLDTRPGKERGKRFKGLAGSPAVGGLFAFESDDGIRWSKMQKTPVVTCPGHAFDSQAAAFWSEAEGVYVCYFRAWNTPHGYLRSVNRSTSPDFLRWSESAPTNPNLPGEHLYTSQAQPYFRAPHIYLALPTRYREDRGSTTDILLMSARAGSGSFARTFPEALIRPGLDPSRWGNRSNYAALGIVPTGPGEMSVYHSISGHRYTLRLDGFSSAHAGPAKGELRTKPVTFSGKELVINYSTSAAGGIQVEIQDAGGAPIPGFGLEDCPVVTGDQIERRIEWKSKPDLGALQGKPVRLRFVMAECDLYSFRFQ
jgi:hypothetical protein